MLAARGQLLLLVDADGATSFPDFDTLEQRLHELAEKDTEGRSVAVGSRAHLVSTDAVVKVGHGFESQFTSKVAHGLFFFFSSSRCSVRLFETF
jgi:dolichyl-phosphate beta-glucosyltransferase